MRDLGAIGVLLGVALALPGAFSLGPAVGAVLAALSAAASAATGVFTARTGEGADGVALCAVATLFGAWEGGLIGVEKENQKLERFHDDIEAGKYVILIYARKDQESEVRHMMTRRHPEAEFAGIDSHFVNPFTAVRRRRRASGDRVRA